MCAEADWRRCHRGLLADALVVRGWSVAHIAPDSGLSEHALSPLATVREGRLTYPAAQLTLR